jgi:hypothetical protein
LGKGLSSTDGDVPEIARMARLFSGLSWCRRYFRLLAGAAVIGLFVLLWLMFPQPVPGLWPPERLDDRLWVKVLVDEYHSLITFPDYDLGCFQEWHMGVESWYLRKDFGKRALFSSLFFPVPATIRFGVFRLNYGLRQGIPADKTFTFLLSEKGRKNMIEYLHSWRGPEISKHAEYWYFASKQRWHVLSNCNAFIGGGSSCCRAADSPRVFP